MTRLKAAPAITGAFILCALAISAPAWAMRTQYNIGSLKGLGGVYVIVQKLDPDMVTDGLAQDKLEAAIVQRLRAGGVRTLDEDEMVSAKGGILYVALDSVKGDNGAYACNVRAELIQVAGLARDRATLVPATTWMTGAVVLVGSKGVPGLQGTTLDVIDEFIQDFRSVNLLLPGTTESARL